MSTVSPLKAMIREAASDLGILNERKSLASEVKQLTTEVLQDWGAVSVSPGGRFGLENLGNGPTPERNNAFDPLRDGAPTKLMHGLKDLKMEGRHIESVTEACLSLFESSYDAYALLRPGDAAQGSMVALSTLVGRTAAMELELEADQVALEAFGEDTNRLASDDRVTMDLIIMRPYDNMMDKAFARVNDSSPVVTVKVPEAQVWDWAKTQDPNSTIFSRNQSYRLRDLYRNPTPVNTNVKKIVPLAANDTTTQVIFASNGGFDYYKSGKDVSLLDLSRDSSKFGYAQVDRTDLIADGGILDNVLISLTKSGGTPVTETFKLNTRVFELAMYVPTPSTKASGMRQVIMECVMPITATTKQYDGSNSTIAAALTDAKLRVKLQISSTLNIQTGALQASGTAGLTLVQLADGTVIGGATNTLFGALSAVVSGYSVDLRFNEENQRKANLAVWVQWNQQQFMVPRSRVYFTEYSLNQSVDDNAIQATSSVVALGNGRRGLDTIVNALNDVSKGMEFAQTSPEIASVNAIDEQSFAASLVKPTVITSTLDFDQEEVNVMNESTRLSELHGRFRARILSMLAMLFAKSLMLNQYKGGEKPVIKLFTHSTIADVVIGILDYHPDLKDEAATATGADFSMVLPNGYRLDIIKSNWDCLQGRIYAVPVIESDMASVLSACQIRDCGTVSTNYTPTNGGSVVRRIATTTREIVMMSNKVGILLEVKGLTAQLGTPGFAQIPLNTDKNDSFVY